MASQRRLLRFEQLELRYLLAGNILSEFTKLADTNTQIPGREDTFTHVSGAKISGENVAFLGTGADSKSGLYALSDTGLKTVADRSTQVLGRDNQFFTNVYDFALDGSDIAFFSYRNGPSGGYNEGIYLFSSTDRRAIVENESFPGLHYDLGLDDGSVAFFAQVPFGPQRIHIQSDGVLQTVIDSNTPLPGTSVTYGLIAHTSKPTAVVDGKAVVFVTEKARQGIYRQENGVTRIVVDPSTPMPGAGEPFAQIQSYYASQGNTVFGGANAIGDKEGIYLHTGSTIEVVVDQTTSIPGTTGTFKWFGSNAVSLDGSNVLFRGGGANFNYGVYTNLGGSLTEVIHTGDTLDGKTIRDLEITEQSISGQTVVFTAVFTNGSRAVYRVDLVSPPKPLTIIIHGFQLLQDFPPWVDDMGEALYRRSGVPPNDYGVAHSILVRSDVEAQLTDGTFALADESAKRIIMFDWSDKSGILYPDTADADNVSGVLAKALASLLERHTYDLHLIGHSRGAYVATDTIRRLAEIAAKSPDVGGKIHSVQLTTLDPQSYNSPFGSDGSLDSNPGGIVGFADNYYQTAGGSLPGDQGEPIPGALNIDITDEVRKWGGRNDAGSHGIGNHQEVHDWYHWTIDPSSTSGCGDPEDSKLRCPDRAVLYPLAVWDQGQRVGYYWSLLGAGVNARPQVVTFSNDARSVYVTKGTAATNIEAAATTPPDPLPSRVDLLLPLLDIKTEGIAPGSSVSVTFYQPGGRSANTYYKYGPTNGDPTPHYYEFLYDETTKTGAQIHGNVVTVYLVDNERGDDDPRTGIIVDPGAPAFDEIPWQNRASALDVTRDGPVSPIDALTVINYLNAALPTVVAPGALIGMPFGFIDVDGDNHIAPIDALLVINFLNAHSGGGGIGGGGEGEGGSAEAFVSFLLNETTVSQARSEIPTPAVSSPQVRNTASPSRTHREERVVSEYRQRESALFANNDEDDERVKAIDLILESDLLASDLWQAGKSKGKLKLPLGNV